MSLYGETLISTGVVLIIAALLIGAVVGGVHVLLSKKLSRQLEKEYGPKDK